jgi:menaquinone-9 beta-reductase
VVVGGGPTGAATASWLSRWGHRVVVVDRGSRVDPPTAGQRALGQAVSPRAVQRLIEVGVDPIERGWHRHRGLRLVAGSRAVDVVWSRSASVARTSVGVPYEVLARALAARARDGGAQVLYQHEAVAPFVERGFVRGTTVRNLATGEVTDLEARYVVVADGAGSSFGRALGTLRTKDWPLLTTVRGQWNSPRHDEVWVESVFGVVEPDGERLVVTTTVIPLGNGQVTIEVNIPSTARATASLQLPALLDHVAHGLASRWGLDLTTNPTRPIAERLPLGLSIRPQSGPTFLVVGDAVAAVNPFNGDGLAFGLESARLAAEVLHDALQAGDPTLLSSYSRLLDQRLGGFFKLGRLFLRQVGRPGTASLLGKGAVRLPGVTARATRFMTGLADVETPADPAERAALAVARSLPEA